MTAPTGQPGTIIFDLDGTLVDSVPDLAGSLDTLMAEKGLSPIGVDLARRLIGHGIPNLVRRALTERGVAWEEEAGQAAIKRFTEIYGSRVAQETRPYADVVAVLTALKAEGWKMGVCTNKMERFARAVVDQLDLAAFFEIVAGPDTFKIGKPIRATSPKPQRLPVVLSRCSMSATARWTSRPALPQACPSLR